jgi:RNA polymerase sigma-70 factor, ECF subfamily
MTDAQTAMHTAQAVPSSTLDDEVLAVRARQDVDAFAELYRRHLERVYRYTLARLGSVEVAEELTAQTFLAAFEGIGTYRGQSVFIAWLLTIARNKVADYYRRRRETVPLDVVTHVAHPDPLPEQVVAERLRLEQVAYALQALSPDRAEALALRIFSGLSAAEVGTIMGKSEAAVKMLVHRAMRDLQQRLAWTIEADS